MKRWIALLLLALPLFAQELKVPDAQQFVGAPQGQPLAGQTLERRAHEVSALLRCPVCQGLSVADSPAEMAVNMKGQVRELLSRGYTEAQILQYFERSYGQYVLLKPKFEGMNTLVWILPIVALIVGAAIVFTKAKKLEQAPVPPAASAEEDPYVARVRRLVDGDRS